MKPLRLREQMLLCGLGLLAIVAAFYLFVYSPNTSEAAGLARQLGAQRTEAARLQKELKGEISTLRDAVSPLEAKLPSAGEIPKLLEHLDDLANQSGVTLTLLKQGVLEPVTGPQAAPARRPPTGGGAATPATAIAPRRAPMASHSEAAKKYQTFTIDLAATGAFPDILRFAHGLESFPRFLAISEMRVTMAPVKKGQDPAEPDVSLGVRATGYARSESGDSP